jgi:ribonuclease HI
MILTIFTDGGSKGNPGPAAIGIVCYDEHKKELFRYRKDIGLGTNNEAEYTAVITALELVKERFFGQATTTLKDPSNAVKGINFMCDSLLVVKQLLGEYKIKTPHIRDFVQKVSSLESELKIPVHYTHIPREQNKLADALVNDAA